MNQQPVSVTSASASESNGNNLDPARRFESGPTDSLGSLPDPRPLMSKSISLAGAAIAGIRPDQMANPTPCGTFDVRALLGHLLGALDRVAVVGRNVENPFARPEHFEPEDGDWVRAWAEFTASAEEAWADPAALVRPTMLPWAAESGALAVRSYVAEFTAHTWDLAQATGQQPRWDDEVLTMSLEVMRQILPAEGRREMFDAIRATMPAEMQSGTDAYAEAIPVATDAPLIDQLVAHVGRIPVLSTSA
jgi:uncharacterized protein (TIGR03086 family)